MKEKLKILSELTVAIAKLFLSIVLFAQMFNVDSLTIENLFWDIFIIGVIVILDD